MTAEPIEYEHGVAIPGHVLPQSEWAKTAVKTLPEAGPLDWPAIFGRTAPVVLDDNPDYWDYLTEPNPLTEL